jgi:hypothetical protein
LLFLAIVKVSLRSIVFDSELKKTYSTTMAYSTTSKSNATSSGIGTEEWTPDLDPDDLRELQEAQHDPSKIVVKLPKESARMGYFSTLCLLFNRMIGNRSRGSQRVS